ncbi:MAG: hypothetical protein RLZZ148_668 [Cyanobacteriota bacterium]
MNNYNIQWPILMLVACVGSLLIALPLKLTPIDQAMATQASSPVLSKAQLRSQAESITVKVLSEEVLGSGFIVKVQNSVYTVLTNAHVLRSGHPPYQIQTPDGQVYKAQLFKAVSFQGKDLALLQFRSPKNTYRVASLGKLPKLEEEVFAAGFPFAVSKNTPGGFVFRTGKIARILDKALAGGYQIGYTNLVEKGMSGGPVLNYQGEVVAINGMHAEPLWGSPYVFIDGSLPEPTLKEEMSQYSWGIPIKIFDQIGLPALKKIQR